MPPELQHLDKEAIAQKYLEAKFENDQLRQRLEWFQRQMFGKKSERFIPTDANQLSLELGELVSRPEEEARTETITYDRKVKSERKEKPVRTGLPAHLRRVEERIVPEGDLTGMVKITEEVSEYLQEKPGEVYVLRVIREVYAYKNQPELGVITPELPSHILPKFNICTGMLALLIVRKYADHLPLYRQIEIYKRGGLVLSDSTVGGWMREGADRLILLYELKQRLIFSAMYLQADETGIRVLDKDKKGQTHKGWYWVYHDPLRGLVWFDYQPGRNASGPQEQLKNYHGYLQTDGYKVYDGFENKPGIRLLCCWAHARRYFEQALKNDESRAVHVMNEIQKLYSIERFADNALLDHNERMHLRQGNAKPILEALKTYLIENLPSVAPQSAIGKAIQYCLARWEKLIVYLEDGSLKIDNNLTENAIRPVALGRKNYLFAGSHEAARRAAMIYSFIVTCKRHEVNPCEWFTDVLGRISNHPINKLEELLPHEWKKLQNKTHES